MPVIISFIFIIMFFLGMFWASTFEKNITRQDCYEHHIQSACEQIEKSYK